MDSKDGSFSRAIAFAIATPFFGTIAATIAKFVQSEVSVYSLLLAQYSVCLVALFPWLVRVGRAGLRTHRPWLHLIRGLAGWGCYFFHYLALSRIPLVDGVSLRNTAPLFVPFIVWAVLKSQPSLARICVAVLGFVGVALVLKPSLDFEPWHLFGLIGGFLLALSMVLTRLLSATETRNRILFYYFAIALILSTPMAIHGSLPFVDSPQTWGLLLATGLAVFTALQCYTVAFSSAPTSAIAPFSYFGVLFGGLWGFLFWNHVPDFISAAGIVVIVIAGVSTIRLGPG